MKRQVMYVFGVYILEVIIVVGYIVGWMSIHPIVLMLPLVGLINYKIERRGHQGLGFVSTGSYLPFLLAFTFAALKLCETLIRLQLEGVLLNLGALKGGALGLVLKFLTIDLFIIALWEEIVSRGYVQTRLHQAWGFRGVAVSALLFAFLHLPSALISGTLAEAGFRILQTGLSGLVLSYLYWKSGSVLVTILLHGLRNFVISLSSYLSDLTFTQVSAVQGPFQLLWSIGELTLMVIVCHFIYARRVPINRREGV
jgi:membrane protease YdiL (CAAX protease family)